MLPYGNAFAKSSDIFIFGDSLSDSGYANHLHIADHDWPSISNHPLIVKQATYTSPDKKQTVWPQFLSTQLNNRNISIPNNLKTPKQNIDNFVTPILNGNNYAAGGATTICKGFGKKGKYTPPPIGPLRPGINCPKDQTNIEKYNQIDNYLNQHNKKADPNAIYIIWGGANDAFIALGKFIETQSPLDKLYLYKVSYN